MRIKQLIIENFRIFDKKIVIDFDNLTAFIGKNDIGKTTVLEALDIFFNGKNAQAKMDKDDLSKGSDSQEITIGVVFENFPEDLIIDADVPVSLKEEYLLNKEGLLEIYKVYPNGDIGKEKTCIKARHPVNDDLKDLLTLKINELKERAKKLRIDLSEEDKRVASRIRRAIRNAVERRDGKLELEEIEILINEKECKKIWDRLKDYLPLYALFKSDRQNLDQDDEVQDPIKFSIKKILRTEEMQKKLEEIRKKVESEITEIANRTIEKLSEMNPEVAQELKPKMSKPKWESVFKGITISSEREIPLNKRGSGVRRLILLNFFRAEAEKKKEEGNIPNIIYAFEEPETSQHPKYQKKLIEAFLKLSEREDTQIILTTHSPGIAGLLPIESLRFLCKENGSVVVKKGSEEILQKIAKSLGILPSVDKSKIDSLKLIVCVEGPTDVDFFKRLATIVDKDLRIDFENDQRIVIIPLGGSDLKHWVDNHYLRKLGLPEVHIYDGDRKDYRKIAEKIENRDDKSRGFTTEKRAIENYVHPQIIEEIFEELKSVSIIDRTQHNWLAAWDKWNVPNKIKNRGVKLREKGIKEKLCTEGIDKMTPELFKELGAWDEISRWFRTMRKLLE